MNVTTAELVLVGVAAQCAAAAAQAPPTRPAATRTVVAAAKLPTVTEKPLYFRAVSIGLPAGQEESIPPATGVLYLVSGAADVSVGGEAKALNPGEGVYIAAGTPASLRAKGGEPSAGLYFVLSPAADLDRPVAAGPAVVNELYRTAQPLPNLKPGAYDLNLTRVTFPAGMPSNAPHHRSGAALYFIVSGTGANTVDGKTEAKGPGSLIYEPSGLVHQWGNPGEVPMTFLTFNINQDGVPAVVADQAAPARGQ